MATWPLIETAQGLLAIAPGNLRKREQTIQHLTDLLVRVINRDAQEQRVKAALTDELTGLLNEDGFRSLAKHQLRLAGSARPVFLAMISMMAGAPARSEQESALQWVAQILRDTFRESDICARVDEFQFAVLGVNTPDSADSMVHDRLLTSSRRHPNHRDIVMNVAVAQSAGNQRVSLEHLMDRAQWQPERLTIRFAAGRRRSSEARESR